MPLHHSRRAKDSAAIPDDVGGVTARRRILLACKGIRRLLTGATIGAYLGLVPTESSSGAQRCQGSITKTGNTHARRLLVEAAWHHKRPLRPSKTLTARRNAVPAAVRARGEAADRRLHHRWTSMEARKKRSTVIAVAVARELAGWCWSLAVMND